MANNASGKSKTKPEYFKSGFFKRLEISTRAQNENEPLLEAFSRLTLDTIRPLKAMWGDAIAIAYSNDDEALNLKQYSTLQKKGDKLRDFLQPVRGVGTILEGLIVFGLFPLFALMLVIKMLYSVGLAVKGLVTKDTVDFSLLKLLALSTAEFLSMPLSGLFKIIRGVTQIVTAPLTWFFKMPIRAALKSKLGKNGFLGRLNKYRDADFNSFQFIVSLSDDLIRPLTAMGIDLINVFRPYNRVDGKMAAILPDAIFLNSSIKADAMQPVRGAMTVLQGLYGIVAFPFFAVALAVWAPLKLLGALFKGVGEAVGTDKGVPNAGQSAATDIRQVVGFGILTMYALLGGLFKVIRGATQIVTTPLTWLIKMPIRGGLTIRPPSPYIAVPPSSSYEGVTERTNLGSNGDPYVVGDLDGKQKFNAGQTQQHETNAGSTNDSDSAKITPEDTTATSSNTGSSPRFGMGSSGN